MELSLICNLLLTISLLFTPQNRRPDGGVAGDPNKDPKALTESTVDRDMWPIVERINRSDWVWTTESCQGHDRQPVVLGIVTDDIGRFFQLLSEAQAKELSIDAEDDKDPGGLRLTVTWWTHPQVSKGRFQVRLTAYAVGEPRAMTLRTFHELSRRITP